ncbi:MAG TPA: RagB/SusD family nutrient uptake outer membrane protein [Chitinophagaceae bacterium]|nr:RagB/SusD family nutrient uptake outer membrane protein [Chitinophagaceae bacterium]
MKKIIPYILPLCFMSFFISCKKFIEVDPPVDKIVFETAFSDDATATASVTGLYSQMMQQYQFFGSYALTLYPGFAADELTSTRNDNTENAFIQNQLTPGNSVCYDLWRTAYKYIYQANACIQGLSAAKTVTDSLRKSLIGEAKFIHAFIYFYLVNLYGDVPLITTTDYQTNQSIARTPADQVYNYMINELLDAQQALPLSYISSGRARPNKFAAEALLSRIYLYRQQWPNTEQAASDIINSGLYSLAAAPANVFLSSSNETIWQLSSVVSNINTYEGNNFLPVTATVVPKYPLSVYLMNSFEAGDTRKTSWVKYSLIGGNTYNYSYKYKVRTGSAVTENPVYLRLAEQYLIRAEARAQQNNIAGAKSDIDIIRSRAGLPASSVSDKNSALAAIEHECQVELFAEWGHRWLDLKRWGRADAVLSPVKSGWQSFDTLWPLPYSELQLNPVLTQNSGY